MIRKVPRPSKRTCLVLLLLLTFFLVLHPIARLTPLRMFFPSVLRPVQELFRRAGSALAEWAGDISTRRDLAKENRELREEITKLQGALAQQYDMRLLREEELKSLKVFLADHADEQIQGVRAYVIGWDSSAWRSSVVVDKGSAQGVEPDQPVVWHDYVVGVVEEVGGTTSRVKLITDPQCRIAARSVRSREKCIVEGTADGKCQLKYVFDAADIRKDDIIVTTGEHGIFPKHVLVGTVVRCEPGEAALFRHVVVQPRLSPARLESVLIIERISARAMGKGRSHK